jgi:putative transposase
VPVNRGERGIWQRRYREHQIRDDTDFVWHFDYSHYNPVKHGCAESPTLWPHSSFADTVARGIHCRDWASPVAFEIGGDG